jgi:hypothetical protein
MGRESESLGGGHKGTTQPWGVWGGLLGLCGTWMFSLILTWLSPSQGQSPHVGGKISSVALEMGLDGTLGCLFKGALMAGEV